MRWQPPVHSPLTWTALTRGALAAARGDGPGLLPERIEELLRARYDASDVVLTDSGTSALRLAIAGVARSGPVALPGYTCYDMASAAEGADARVLLYDVSPETLGPEPSSLEAVVAAGAGAVVVGHLFGHLVDLCATSRSIGDALLIEDAAQGVGGEIGGRRLGSFGSVSVLSFGRGKGMTGGGGGALLAHDERGLEITRWARGAMEGAISRGGKGVVALAAQLLLGRPWVYGLPASLPFLHLGETIYHPPQPPGPPTVSSLAVLERVVTLSDLALEVRRSNARRLLEALEGVDHLRAPTGVPDGEPGFLRLPVVRADDATPAGGRRLGVATGYPTPLTALPSLRSFLVDAEPELPGAALLATHLLTLPTHALLSERDVSALVRWITAGALESGP